MSLKPTFDRCREENRAALILYLCAGDPSLSLTADVAVAAAQAGADVVELGIPYSDPIADGPTIQAAAQRALAAGATVAGVLECARQIHERSALPLVIMTCFNPILQFGPERFARRAAEVGISAVLVSDLPPEESGDWPELAARHGLETVFLVAPTTEPQRLSLACELSTGFVYVVSRPGTTGERADLPPDLSDLLARLRQVTDRPLAVGFGISTPDHAHTVAAMADGVIVGSALVRLIGEKGPGEELLPAVGEFVQSLTAAVRR